MISRPSLLGIHGIGSKWSCSHLVAKRRSNACRGYLEQLTSWPRSTNYSDRFVSVGPAIPWDGLTGRDLQVFTPNSSRIPQRRNAIGDGLVLKDLDYVSSILEKKDEGASVNEQGNEPCPWVLPKDGLGGSNLRESFGTDAQSRSDDLEANPTLWTVWSLALWSLWSLSSTIFWIRKHRKRKLKESVSC